MYRVTYNLGDEIAEIRIFKSLDNATAFTTSLTLMNLSFMIDKIEG
jgi:hypothetical protein